MSAKRETDEAKLRRLATWYVQARSRVTRQMVGGAEVLSITRWDLVNAQHALAEHVAEMTARRGGSR
jgi:hypothetical protein